MKRRSSAQDAAQSMLTDASFEIRKSKLENRSLSVAPHTALFEFPV
jgi:hypothetical protein